MVPDFAVSFVRAAGSGYFLGTQSQNHLQGLHLDLMNHGFHHLAGTFNQVDPGEATGILSKPAPPPPINLQLRLGHPPLNRCVCRTLEAKRDSLASCRAGPFSPREWSCFAASKAGIQRGFSFVDRQALFPARTVFECNPDELAAGSHSSLLEELLQCCFHRAFRDVETPPNFFIAKPLKYPVQNMLLPFREPFGLGRFSRLS
jgi:hypothetical protein